MAPSPLHGATEIITMTQGSLRDTARLGPGRPTDLARAAQDPQQTRISLGPGTVFPATPSQQTGQQANQDAGQRATQPVPEIVVRPATKNPPLER